MMLHGSIGLVRPSVGEEDYLGAARSIRAMTDILGPVAALLQSMEPIAPGNIVGPYNRARNAVIIAGAQLLGEAKSFVYAQSSVASQHERWQQMGTRMLPDLLPAMVLPKITGEWSRWTCPDQWTESVRAWDRDWPVTGPTAWADRIIAAWSDKLPQIETGPRWIFEARYGGGAKALGALPVAVAVIGWLLVGGSAMVDIVDFFTATADAAQAQPQLAATPAIDSVNDIRTKFERAFIPAVYQPVRSAAKIVTAANADQGKMALAMSQTDPYLEPAAPVIWDGTFGFGSSGSTASASDSWFGPVLVGGAVALMMALLLGGD